MKLVVGNQKNYMSLKDVSLFLKDIKLNDNVIICPSNIYIPFYLKRGFKLATQNICENKTITGEITFSQAKSLGINTTILGHSERRSLYETNEIINCKIKEAIENDFKIILCVGETEDEMNEKEIVLKKELEECLKDVTNFENIIIAYEPIWAIGTGKIPSNNDIYESIKYIKDLTNSIYNTEIKVLYGGSVNSENIKEINQIENLDGVLVGKASTNIDEFLKIIEVVNS